MIVVMLDIDKLSVDLAKEGSMGRRSSNMINGVS